MSISDRLTQLLSIRTSIRNALATKLEYDVSDHDYSDFATDITNIVVGGGGTDVSDTTATAESVREGFYFYDSDGVKTEGLIPTLDENTSVITVTGTEKTSKRFDGYASIINAEIDADSKSNLIPENIRENVPILGVLGAFKGSGGQLKHGIFVLTNANQVTISDVGFRPDILIVYNDPEAATNSYRTECCYASPKATGRFSKNFGINATSARRNQDMPNTLAGYINEVTDTGFKFKPFNANYATAATGTYFYAAFKLS